MAKDKWAAIQKDRQVVKPEFRIGPGPKPEIAISRIGISEIEAMGEAMARKWEEEG